MMQNNAMNAMPGLALPEPDAAAVARSARLCALIIEDIHRRRGLIGFDRFMEWALYAPDLGYYNGDAAAIGAAGDFVTAPVVSALFSCCVS